MESESDYAYEGKDKTCRYSASKGQVKVSDWHWVSGNSSAMMAATNKSAMSVAIYASARSFSTYKSGIYTNATCSTDINHGVAVVGYSSNDQYWIVRNSWGTGWGESGYIRMAMTDGKGTCGIN
jgi:C1A family cysteine protease